MGCAMCLTGKMGLLASLSRSQIIEQVVQVSKWKQTHQNILVVNV